MSERFTKLFSLSEDLYAEGSPVVVSAGNLLKDNQTGKVLAQLKIKNISEKAIKAATVLIHALDTTGKTIGGDIEQEYLDLSIKQGEEFGQKVAILLPNISTRGFTVEVKQVVFTDNSIWGGQDMNWEPLPDAKLLINEFGDAELVKQYRLKFGGECKVSPTEHKDLWRCACGTWNRTAKCYSCAKEKAGQLAFDIDILKADKDARLAKEKEERDAKEASDKAAAEAAAKKTKKLLAIVLPVVFVSIAMLLTIKVFIPTYKYNQAVRLLENGSYEDAAEAFVALGSFRDSNVMIQEAENAKAYAEAERLLSGADYEGAISAFTKLGDYRDSKHMLSVAEDTMLSVLYKEAENYRKIGDYESAIAAFDQIIAYQGSSSYISKAKDAKKEAIYARAEALALAGKTFYAAKEFYQIKGYKDSWERCFALWGMLSFRQTVAAGNAHGIGITRSGDLLVVGESVYYGGVSKGRCDIDDWRDIVALSVSDYHTVGLQKDGRVLAVGTNAGAIAKGGRCDVGAWRDIVAIFADMYNTYGIRGDGVLLKTGIGEMAVRDVIAVSRGSQHTVFLIADGTVKAGGANLSHECDVSDWTDIVAVATGDHHTVGLRSDGTVVATGANDCGQCDVSRWSDIVAICACSTYTVGLRSDGTVVAVGQSDRGGCNVSKWSDITAIFTNGHGVTFGIKADGSMVSTYNKGLAGEMGNWEDVLIP